MPKDCLLGAARRRTLICCLAPRSLPPVLLALALGRRVSRKSACKDRSSLGSISRFVSARQLDLIYDRDSVNRLGTQVAIVTRFHIPHVHVHGGLRAKLKIHAESAVAKNGR